MQKALPGRAAHIVVAPAQCAYTAQVNTENGTRLERSHDDVASVVAGALVTAFKETSLSNFRQAIVFPKVGLV